MHVVKTRGFSGHFGDGSEEVSDLAPINETMCRPTT
jgi:hypothetical protein